MPLGENRLKESNPQKHFRCQIEGLKHISATATDIEIVRVSLCSKMDPILDCLLFGLVIYFGNFSPKPLRFKRYWVWLEQLESGRTQQTTVAACRLTKHGHLRVLSHAAQRRMRIEPDHWGMHEKLSHRDLCDLTETHGREFKKRSSDGGRTTSQTMAFHCCVRYILTIWVYEWASTDITH